MYMLVSDDFAFIPVERRHINHCIHKIICVVLHNFLMVQLVIGAWF